MLNRFVSGLVLASSVAWSAPIPGAVDAFISRKDVSGLVDAAALSPAAREALANGFVSATEPRYGVPTFFWAAPGSTPAWRDRGLSPDQAARRYLWTYAEIYRASPVRWAEAQVSQVHDLGDGTAVIVTFQQRVNGVRVFRDELKVIMNSKLQLVALSGYLTPQTRVRGESSLSAPSAVGVAFQSLVGRALEPSELTALGQFNGGYTHWQLAGESTPVRTRPVMFPLPEGVVPGFYIELEARTSEEGSSYVSCVVSAVDGALLYRKNLSVDAFGYKVWADAASKLPHDGPQGTAATPHPTGTPNRLNPGTVTQTLITLDNAGLSTMDPWLATGATTTRGNNVVAYADLVRSNGYTATGDVMGTTTATDVFDYTYDFGQGPEANTSQRQAAVVQLFYNNNFFHDWYYDDGFDEASGNGQASNLGRGGLGNDAVLSEAQDYSGRDNANMSTPSDGASPRMQMYIFDGTDTSSLVANTSTVQNFNTLGADFGQQVHALTAPLMLANDGDATPTDGCAATWPANSAAGKIVLVDRGSCTFVEKATRAAAAGAVGVIIANNMGNNPMAMPGNATNLNIPVMSVSLASGNTLKGLITSGGGATTMTMTRTASLNRDGTLDNGVVAHEWGHYISNRLIGDGNGISNLQAGGMGEGWGDFHAALLVARESDAQVPSNANWAGTFSLASWAGSAIDPEAYYFGFRRYPLSTNLAKNPLTFKHIGDGAALPSAAPIASGFSRNGADNSEVHNTGEVWAAMLWECYVSLLRDPRHSFSQAQARMKRYLVAAYKATPLMPTMVEARDAVLAVAAANDSTDFASFWGAFARRGIGMGAVAPDRDSPDNTPVVESFTVGNAVLITDITLDDSKTSCDHDGNLDANERGVLTVKLRNTGISTLSTAQVAITTTTTGVTFPMGASQAMPATAPFGTSILSFPVELGNVAMPQAGMFTVTVTDASLAQGPATKQAMFRLNFDVLPGSSRMDDVEAPQSNWTVSSDMNLTTGSDFRIFQSSATQHYWFGPNPASPADTRLTSPALQVGTGTFTVTFKHRYDFERDATEFYDGALIEVSTNNGGSWTDVGNQVTPTYDGTLTTSQNQSLNPLRGKKAFVGKSPNYPSFQTATLNLGTTYANKTVLLRFRIGADDAAAAKGWEIDDITFAGINNSPFTSVTSDPNTCTNHAPVVTIGPDTEVLEGELVTLVGSATDADNDALTLTWTQTSGPAVTITNGAFTAPNVEVDTPMTVQLVVSDGRAVSLPLEQRITVKNVNRPPVASVPATQEANMGDQVTVFGTGTDPDGDAITYEWSQLEGPTVALTGATTDTVGFTAPAVTTQEVVKLQLVVRDALHTSAPAIIDVVVKNPAPQVIDPDPTPKGCGCTSGLELLPVLALGLLFRRRRSS